MTDNREILTRRAPLAATSWNPEERTLEVIITTGADVDRGTHIERLNLDQNWASLAGKPVLNAHRRGSVGDVLGSVVRAWRTGTEVRAIIKLSHRPKVDAIVQDIRDGHIRGVSFGFTVERWSTTTEGGRTVRTAETITPLEISLVPIGADPGAQIRSDAMPKQTLPAPKPKTTPAPAGDTIDRAAINTEIRSIASVANLNTTWADGQIDAEATADDARRAAFEAIQTRAAPAAQVRANGGHNERTLDNPEIRGRAMGEAIFTRTAPDHKPSDEARPFIGLTMVEMGRECLRAGGHSLTGLAPNSVITRALHSTSDFPLALGDSVGRTLRNAYNTAPSSLKQAARQTTLRDFRTRSMIQLSQFSALEKVNQLGEIRRGTFEEDSESIRLSTFAKIFGVSRQVLVNDDIGALADIPRKLGIASAQFEANELALIFSLNSGAGPTMSDGKTMFHADHGNTGGSAGPAPVTTLPAARKTMREQTDASGQLIMVTSKYLVVSPENEYNAEIALAEIAPATSADVNPFAGKLTLIVEPRFATSKRWYLAADPGEIDGLIYAYLEGEEGPQTETRTGFDVDGIEVRLDFGTAFADWRGWHLNPGE